MATWSTAKRIRLRSYGEPSLGDLWADVASGIDSVLRDSQLRGADFELLTRSVYNYCCDGNGQGTDRRGDLYFRLRDYLVSHLETRLESNATNVAKNVLAFYNSEWQRFKHSAVLLTDMFEYLN